MKEKKETLSQLKKKVQVVFNEWIRNRDKVLPCIACGEIKESYHAGHLFCVKKYDGLRFHEYNVNNECPSCNLFDESHVLWYRINLIKKIGLDKYQELEDMAKEYRSGKKGPTLSREQLEFLLAKYKKLNKENILNAKRHHSGEAE